MAITPPHLPLNMYLEDAINLWIEVTGGDLSNNSQPTDE